MGRPSRSCLHDAGCSFDPGPRPELRKASFVTPLTPFTLSSPLQSAFCLVIRKRVSISSKAPRHRIQARQRGFLSARLCCCCCFDARLHVGSCVCPWALCLLGVHLHALTPHPERAREVLRSLLPGTAQSCRACT